MTTADGELPSRSAPATTRLSANDACDDFALRTRHSGWVQWLLWRTYQSVAGPAFTNPYDCCNHCRQSYQCNGFTIDATGMCTLKNGAQLAGPITPSLTAFTLPFSPPPPPEHPHPLNPPPPPSPPPLPLTPAKSLEISTAVTECGLEILVATGHDTSALPEQHGSSDWRPLYVHATTSSAVNDYSPHYANVVAHADNAITTDTLTLTTGVDYRLDQPALQ